MFTGLQQLVEMGDHQGFTEVIQHSKFCSKLNQATKPVIKRGAKSSFLHQFSLGRSKGHTRGLRWRAGRVSPSSRVRTTNRQGLLMR